MGAVDGDDAQSIDLISTGRTILHMSIHTRACGLALSAVCLSSGLLGGAATLAPGSAAAAGTLPCASEITGSGSSLQKSAQIEVFIKDFTSTLCVTAPKVTYTKTSSGPALEEFGNETEALIPAKSGNGTSLDGYAGSDDPPQPVQLNKAGNAGGGGDQQELTVPVAEAPVALLLTPPTGCLVTADPTIPNTVLDQLWQDKYASWDAFLTAASVAHEGAACASSAPSLIVRRDGSGTSYVFKSYLAQIDSGAWSSYANDGTVWPDSVTLAAETGGSGEAKAVKGAPGSVGYAAASDAHAAEFGPWSAGATSFWADAQNNGTEIAGATFADPANAANGNCPTAVTPAGAPSAPGSWLGVLASSPHISSATGFVSGQYSLCGLTYDLAWKDYRAIGGKGQTDLYGGTAAAAQETGNATADFLTYVTHQGQTDLAGAGKYYSALPLPVQKVAQETVADIEGANVSPASFTAGFTVTTSAPQPGQVVSFDAASSTVPAGDSITGYRWSFGDGSSPEVVTSPTDQHTYAAAGNYEVTLTVTDVFGNTTQTTQTIPILAPTTGGGTSGGGTTHVATTSTTTTTTQPTTVAPKVTATIASTHGNQVAVTVSCPAGASTCAGAVTVKTAGAIAASVAKAKKSKKTKKVAPFTVGSQTFSISGGQSKTLQVTINAKAAALLRQKGTLSLIATITVSGGNTLTEHVTLHAKKAIKKHGK
jgi:PKD repeat protein/ABC-type phosphate transport system substrate-binding protein